MGYTIEQLVDGVVKRYEIFPNNIDTWHRIKVDLCDILKATNVYAISNDMLGIHITGNPEMQTFNVIGKTMVANLLLNGMDADKIPLDIKSKKGTCACTIDNQRYVFIEELECGEHPIYIFQRKPIGEVSV